jgi:hypothetical protein
VLMKKVLGDNTVWTIFFLVKSFYDKIFRKSIAFSMGPITNAIIVIVIILHKYCTKTIVADSFAVAALIRIL